MWKARKLPTLGFTHEHAMQCERDFWFCCMMEGWARGCYPIKEEILKKVDEAESFINQCSDGDIRRHRLICVPWKDLQPCDNTPPRIKLNKFGGAEWTCMGENADESRVPLSLNDPDASGVAEADTTSQSVTKMAAYVKGTIAVGRKVYNECIRVASRKRKLDMEWGQRAAEWSVENEVYSGSEPDLYKKRKIDDQWQERMDRWDAAKRQCQKHFEAWRKVKSVGVGDRWEGMEEGEVKDDDDDYDDNGGDNYDDDGGEDGDDDYDEDADDESGLDCGCGDDDEDDAHGETVD